MRANISINTDGITQPSVKPAPPDGGATVNRNNQPFVVTISANPSARAEGEWLATVYQAALTIRQPLHHHGLISIDSKGRQPFQRLIYPLAPAHARSINHRVLPVATLNNHPNHPMI